MEAKLRYLQIDNMMYDTPFPVVFHPVRAKKQKSEEEKEKEKEKDGKKDKKEEEEDRFFHLSLIQSNEYQVRILYLSISLYIFILLMLLFLLLISSSFFFFLSFPHDEYRVSISTITLEFYYKRQIYLLMPTGLRACSDSIITATSMNCKRGTLKNKIKYIF